MLSTQTYVHLAFNCYLDRDYTNVMNPNKFSISSYYGTKNNAGSYTRLTYNNATYIKGNTIRVPALKADVQASTYLHFYNNSDGWDYYAWVDDIKYISDNCTEITFTIDIWSTWVKSGWNSYGNSPVHAIPCFIIRKHFDYDEFYTYQPENFNIGAYVCQRYNRFTLNNSLLNENGAVFVSSNTPDGDGDVTDLTKIMCNQFTGLLYTSLKQRSPYASGMYDNFITQFNSHPDDLVAILSCPYWLCENATYDNHYLAEADIDVQFTVNRSKWRNLKCYTYPYTRLVFSNQNGSSIEFNPSDLMYQSLVTSNSTYAYMTFRFHLVGSIAPTPEVFCYPSNFRGLTSNMDYGLKLSNFPSCAWASDYFLNWWSLNKAGIDYSNTSAKRDATLASAQNNASASIGLTQNTLNTAGNLFGGVNNVSNGLMRGNIAGAISSGVSTGLNVASNALNASSISLNQSYTNQLIANNYQDTIFANANSINQAMLQPNPTHGSTSSGSLDYGIPNKCGYLWYQEEQRIDLMQYIDDFFSLYGYSFNQIGYILPARTHFDYYQVADKAVRGRASVNTSGVNFNNNTTQTACPREALDKINEIFRRGVRIWNDSNFDNYAEFTAKVLDENKASSGTFIS